MASRSSIGIRVQLALEAIRDVLSKHDPEARGRLSRVSGATTDAPDQVPSFKYPDQCVAYLAESVASLAQIVDQRLTRRPPGRPRKDAQ